MWCLDSLLSEIPDFSLCILRVHNLSDHESERMHGSSATNAAPLHVFFALASVFIFYSISSKVLPSEALWDLCTFSESLFAFLQKQCKWRSMRCGISLQSLVPWSLTLLSWPKPFIWSLVLPTPLKPAAGWGWWKGNAPGVQSQPSLGAVGNQEGEQSR